MKYPFALLVVFHDESTAIKRITTDKRTMMKLNPSRPTKYSALKSPHEPSSSVIHEVFSMSCEDELMGEYD